MNAYSMRALWDHKLPSDSKNTILRAQNVAFDPLIDRSSRKQ